jgi:hypothetical protein
MTIGLAGCLSSSGCGGMYATPGRGADLRALSNSDAQTDTSIKSALAKKPLAVLPCGIAAVRIQAPGYVSDLGGSYGTGNYCVVTTRDVESDDAMKSLRKLPMVVGVAPVNRLLLPATLNSDLELRQAAASLHADMLLIYTIDTTYAVEDHLAPLTVATLGLSPNMTAQIVTTASAVLMDTRNGYIYGFAEATEKGMQLTNGWMTQEAVKDARHGAEVKAFDHLVKNLAVTWTGVVANLDEMKTTVAANARDYAAEPSGPTSAPRDPTRVVQIPPPGSTAGITPSASMPPEHTLGRNPDSTLTGDGGHFAAGGAIDPLTGGITIVLVSLAGFCYVNRSRMSRQTRRNSLEPRRA